MNVAKERAQIIHDRLNERFSPSHLEVIDDSDQHKGHSGHQGGGRHFTVIISAEELNVISRIEAHRKIYSLFDDMMPNQIHALQIKIVSS